MKVNPKELCDKLKSKILFNRIGFIVTIILVISLAFMNLYIYSIIFVLFMIGFLINGIRYCKYYSYWSLIKFDKILEISYNDSKYNKIIRELKKGKIK